MPNFQSFYDWLPSQSSNQVIYFKNYLIIDQEQNQSITSLCKLICMSKRLRHQMILKLRKMKRKNLKEAFNLCLTHLKLSRWEHNNNISFLVNSKEMKSEINLSSRVRHKNMTRFWSRFERKLLWIFTTIVALQKKLTR